MNWTKFSIATVMVAALIASPATAYADPVPTPDEVVGIMAKLTDPSISAANKADIVTPGFSPDEAGPIDDHLNSLNARGGHIPFNFIVTDIQPAPDNFAGATVVAQPNGPHPATAPAPIVLVKQGGRWLITHDAALNFMNAVWSHYRIRYVGIRWFQT
jgi:hypothetical protein